MNTTPKTGALQSPLDERDWTAASVAAPTADAPAVFLDTAWMVPSMQAQIGCCVGCTYEETIRQIVYSLTGVESNPGTENELSWRFVYAMCKSLEGTAGYTQFKPTADANDGTYPALAAQVIRKYGVPLAKYCPNDTTLSAEDFCYGRVLGNIPQIALTDASSRKAGADITFPITKQGIMDAVTYAKANKGSVAILRQIGDSYWTDANGNSTWQKAKLFPAGTLLRAVPPTSGHEETLFGYETEVASGRIILHWLNHWSPNWGSTSGVEGGKGPQDTDGGFGMEYLDAWLPYIVELRVSVAALPPAPTTFKYTFTKNLSTGAQGPDVVALQHILQLENCFPETQAFTGYYGSITAAGVTQLQEKYAAAILAPAGLTTGTGVVAGHTIAWLNSKYGA